jgi:hypothetical protein
LKVAERFTLVPPERLAASGKNWIAIGLSSERADRRRGEAGVRLAYRRAGLGDGVRIIWALSPRQRRDRRGFAHAAGEFRGSPPTP